MTTTRDIYQMGGARSVLVDTGDGTLIRFMGIRAMVVELEQETRELGHHRQMVVNNTAEIRFMFERQEIELSHRGEEEIDDGITEVSEAEPEPFPDCRLIRGE